MTNVYALPSHQEKTRTHGVDYARVISPMKNLNGYRGIKTEIYNHKFEKHNDPTEWFEVMENNQIFFFNYIHNPWGFAAFGTLARKFGVKLVMDLDDDIWDLHDDNPAKAIFHKGSEALSNFTSICNEVDYMTTTNEYLRNVIINNTNKTADKIKIIPNYIDLKLYDHKSPFKDDGQIQLLHFGSSTHGNDLDDHQFFLGVDRIMKEYPNVALKTVSGSFLAKFRKRWGQRYEFTEGQPDVYTWIKDGFRKSMDETDILVVPLIDDIYNRCKSQIKWLEASSAGKPGIFQDIRQYSEVVNGSNGILASKDTEWYRGIKSMIDDKELRRKMGQNAFEDVKDWQIQEHLNLYADFFLQIS